MLSYSVVFKAPRELWNPLSKAVSGEFHWSDRHSNWNRLQDGANFYRSWAGLVLIFNTVPLVEATLTEMDETIWQVSLGHNRIKKPYHNIQPCISMTLKTKGRQTDNIVVTCSSLEPVTTLIPLSLWLWLNSWLIFPKFNTIRVYDDWWLTIDYREICNISCTES